MRNEDAQKLAEKIAKLISAESVKTDLSSLQKNIDTIERRLATLETAFSNFKFQISDFGFEISNPQSSHPSQDRFAIAEAIADSLFDGDAKEKACSFEPTEKPCDHCSMCNSRGF